MDKIVFADWNSVFSTTEHRMLFTSERYNDSLFRFEEPGLVSGFVQSVSTPNMTLTEFSIHAGGPFKLVDKDTHETAESVFVLNGGAESHFHNLCSSQVLNKNRHNFQYNHQFGGEHIIHSGDFHALTITYDLQFLRQLLETDDSRSIGQLGNYMHGQKPWIASTEALSFQGRLSEVIGSMRQCPFNGVTRYLYLESKMMELFVLQMEQAQSMIDSKDNANWSIADRNKLHAVKNYIENAYLDVFNLKDLTYRFGLNEFKLKKGYRQLFQTTVFGHVHQLRMQKAKVLLEEKAMNVSETAFFIGYNNVASFCTEFKKRFGCSPGKICL
jgi:AraC-like DNA-binding protein